MRRLIMSALRGAVLIALLIAGGSALAEAKLDRDDRVGGGSGRSHKADAPRGNAYGRESSTTHSVPEFGPAAAGALAVLVAGGGVLLARRRRR
jgi:hypothetical protein